MSQKRSQGFCLMVGALFAGSAFAAGYYNLGVQWKGAINPYHLGAVVYTDGFSTQSGYLVIGNGDGIFNGPYRMAFDSAGNIYVADSNNSRIVKYNSSGIFQGWIGAIGTSPTGGAPGCAGAAVGTFTPGWCKGGTSDSGDGDGMLALVTGIAIDSSDNLYVADSGNARIIKYNSSGAALGWIGGVLQTPTGGASGCTSATSTTPGWCTGGKSGWGVLDGHMQSPNSVTLDSAGNLYVADFNNHRVVKFNSSGVEQGWIGKIAATPTGGAAGCSSAAVGSITPGWCTGGKATSGTGDGMLNNPFDAAVDSAGNVYVADTYNYRISKFDSSGVFQGWLGAIGTSPTGGAAGCAGAAAGTATPGWCKGGTATNGSGDGMFTAIRGVYVDSSDYIYVSDDFAHRVSKISSSGVFQGWIGSIATSPTGGAPGCAGAAVGTFTPGWCKGGTPGTGSGVISPQEVTMDSSGNLYVVAAGIMKYNSSLVFQGTIQSVSEFLPWHRSKSSPVSGNHDGMMSFPVSVAKDSSGNLYVVDPSNQRINKYDSTGAFQGWIGRVQSTPTGGAAGCSSAAFGNATPGWCKGGSAFNGSGDGMLNSPGALALTSTGDFYVADTTNHRISKYNSAGVFQGWIGKIAASPTGGDTGCSGASVGTFTPGWCKGGTSASGTGDGMVSSPGALVVDLSGNLYVSDTSNHRIDKYSATGAFQGWIGKIATSPSGGATGCNGASVGTFTPGWCTGGTSASGTDDGMMNSPGSVALDSSGNIYVVDTLNSRINKYDSTGAFQGWIGAIATSPTAGAAGCNGAAVGSYTPGWCKGGTSASGTGDGMLSSPSGIAIDSAGSIYVSDTGNHRINKYRSTGVFQGWMGGIAASPTGGATGCKGASVGSFTPGWCKGGTSSSGNGYGMLKSPKGLMIDSSGNLYVTDSGNSRLIRYSTQGR